MNLRNIIMLLILVSALISCNESGKNYLIDQSEEDKIKKVIVESIDDYGLNEFEKCYFKKYIKELVLNGTFYNVIFNGVLIKYMYFEDLGFYYSIVKNEDTIFFVGFHTLLQATRHHNNVVDENSFDYTWKNFNSTNSAEIRSLNVILDDSTKFKSNREIGSFIKVLYSIEESKVLHNFQPLYNYSLDDNQITDWLSNNFSVEEGYNVQILEELKVAEIHDYDSRSFILLSDIFGLHYYNLEKNRYDNKLTCKVLFSNHPHEFYIAGNDVTIVAEGDCSRLRQ